MLGSIFALVLFFLMPYISEALYPNESHVLITQLTYYMLPCLIFTGTIGVLFGILCTSGNTWLPAMNPAISSISMIICIVLFANKYSGLALCFGVSIGVILQCLSLIIAYCKVNKTSSLAINYSKFRHMLMPAMLSSTIGSLNVYVDMLFCKQLSEGSWTALILGNRLIQLPFGVLVGGALVAFLPAISKLKNNPIKFKLTLNNELLRLIRLLMPVCVGLLALAVPIITITLERGVFNAQSTLLVSSVLFFLAFSLITAVPREITTRAFYGLGDSRTPFIISLISIGFNILFNYIFVKYWSVGGIAFSTTLTSFINSCILIYLLRRQNLFQINIVELLKIIGAGMIMYIVIIYLYQFEFINHLLLKTSITGIIGLLAYIGVLYILKTKHNESRESSKN